MQSIENALLSCDSTDMAERMAGHYRRMRLLRPDGTWASALLARNGPEWLPGAVSAEELKNFVGKMLDLQMLNPFFRAFLERTSGRRFPQLEAALRAEGHRAIPDALALAMALDRLTCACRRDFRIWAECRRMLKQGLRQTGAWREGGLFLRIKLASIYPVVSYSIRAHERPPEALGADSCSRWLQVNILEAVCMDLCGGWRSNAQAGWILVRHKPGRKTPDPATGNGPNRWSADGQAICLHPPLPREWADLYQIWNMAFISHWHELPYLLAPLSIPQVAGYAAAPEAYMYSRVVALHLFLSWLLMGRAENKETQLCRLPWNDPALTRILGDCARESALQYRELVRQARLSRPGLRS